MKPKELKYINSTLKLVITTIKIATINFNILFLNLPQKKMMNDDTQNGIKENLHKLKKIINVIIIGKKQYKIDNSLLFLFRIMSFIILKDMTTDTRK